ncbi:dihydroxy-acid dehydratase [Phytoactinopolyspora sp. XMNu-373]|uniref:Dihydroxy-acid dehydratase n=1 Tax=Phytoactinopolyspora mesophila TaxID=2650750 RepID=A0A7K3LZI6_9ACTN|nr:dihydroxy-acid dehydratase [Phytoactinopolyspora mesophila]
MRRIVELRSNFPANSAHAVTRRAQWVSLGIDPADLDRPKVAIVNTSNDLAACFAHLDGLVSVLKDELRALGMLPFEIRTAAPSDFITNAGRGGRYVLPARDLVANDIEVMVEGAQLDAMICLSSCDKTTPAHLMAAGRLNVPAVIVPCGYQRSGLAEGGEADVEEIFLRAAQQALDGKADGSLLELADGAIRGPGVCSGLATANSMHMAAEALGMAVTGSAPVRALSDRMWDGVRRAARAVANLVENDVRPRDIITAASITNAVRTMLAVGGSINTVKHLQAVAVETGLDIDVWEAYRVLGRETPTLCSIRPNGADLIEDLEDAGGAATVLRELLPLLDGDQLTVDGRTLAENAAAARPGDGAVIRGLNDPFSTDPSIVVLRGTLAEHGAVVKRPIPDPGPRRFRGPAKVFHSREEGVAAVAANKIQAGDVAIIRGIGVTGGPAMGMISAFIFALDGRGLASEVAVVTDGQMSGLVNHGIGVGEVSPEAAAGGALGLVKDGDLIEIDLADGRIDLLVDPEVLAARPPFTPREQVETTGLLDQYRATVQPLACGAVLSPRLGPTPGARR